MSRSRAALASLAVLIAVAAFGALTPPGAGAASAPDPLGVYRGSANPDGVREFEDWLDRPVPWALDFLSGESWESISNPGWWADGWAGTGYRVVYSVPILPDTGGSLAEGARGAYNHHFKRLGELLVRKGQANAVLRLGWEFNGGWFRWSAIQDPAAFVGYWRQIVTTMRSVPGAAFEFDWCPNGGWSKLPLEKAYPGAEYVDYIGLDSYDAGWGEGWEDPVKRWQHALTEPYGLLWHRAFAAAQKKPMTYPEWGLHIRDDGHGGGDNPYYIEQMHKWITSNNVAYAMYFEFDAHDGEHALMKGHFPTSAARFKALFGGGGSGGAPTAGGPTGGGGSAGGAAPAPIPAPAPSASPPPATPAATQPADPSPRANGYLLARRDGRVTSIQGEASAAAVDVAAAPARMTADVVALAAADTGFWLAGADGGVFTAGGARFHGSTGHLRLNRPITGMAGTGSGEGYWLVASDGGIFAFGDATFHGSTGGIRLNKPIVGMAATPSGRGYWLVASDGGIFTFGDARFHGSTGAIQLAKPIVGMAASPSGRGYWLVASDGGIFTFGDARFHGSTGGRHLAAPIVGIAPTATGRGYRLVGADGSVQPFGDAPVSERRSGRPGPAVVAVVSRAR